MHTTGRLPAIASPAAKVTACCSQMPTSKTRSGNSLAKASSPVDEAMAAVTATTFGRRAEGGAGEQSLAEDVGVGQLGLPRPAGQRVGLGADGVQLVDLVVDGGTV